MPHKIKVKNLEKIFNFLHQVEHLKSTLRYTSLASGRKESSAEHSWRLALMTFLVAEALELDLDSNHAVRVALVHDVAESVTGDIDAVKIGRKEFSEEEKHRLEMQAIKKIKNKLPLELGREIHNLWFEYEKSLTPEAKFVKALDKLETLTQLAEAGYKTYDAPEFIANYADLSVQNFSALKGMLKIVKRKLKAEFRKGNIPWKKEYNAYP
ncbi:MAG: HD domain-containing protein [Candidatus Doudnabacteria bacterium]